jgi:hypothetical protein
MKKIAELREEVEPAALHQRTKDALELAELDDESLRADLEAEVEAIEAETASAS